MKSVTTVNLAWVEFFGTDEMASTSTLIYEGKKQ